MEQGQHFFCGHSTSLHARQMGSTTWTTALGMEVICSLHLPQRAPWEENTREAASLP